MAAHDARARPNARPARLTNSVAPGFVSRAASQMAAASLKPNWAPSRASARPEHVASRHPRPPQVHSGPSGSTTTWPASPRHPPARSTTVPSATRAALAPVPRQTHRSLPADACRGRFRHGRRGDVRHDRSSGGRPATVPACRRSPFPRNQVCRCPGRTRPASSRNPGKATPSAPSPGEGSSEPRAARSVSAASSGASAGMRSRRARRHDRRRPRTRAARIPLPPMSSTTTAVIRRPSVRPERRDRSASLVAVNARSM